MGVKLSINESIYEIASKPLISIDINEYVSNAVNFMYERGLRRLAVKQGDQIVGIFNLTSLLKILLEGSNPSNLTLSSIELESPIYVTKTTPIKEAIDIMNQKDITSVLVGDPEKIYGILTTHDIIYIISSIHPEIGVQDILDKEYPVIEINDSKMIDAVDNIINKHKSGVLVVNKNNYVGTITMRDIIKIYSDMGLEGLEVNLVDIPIDEGAYGSIGLSLSDLASIMYNKGSDVIAIFCSHKLCGGIDDLMLTRYFKKIIEG
jgi:predicted transcriptional regulator